MWRPPGSPPRTAPQPGKSVRFEPVRSALPPSISGTFGASSASAFCEALREAIVSRDWPNSAIAASSVSSKSRGRSPAMRRSNSLARSGCSRGRRQIARATPLRARRRAPARSIARAASSGISKGGCGQSSASRVLRISSAPSGSPCALAVPGPAGRALADGGAADDQRRAGRVDCLACRDGRADHDRIVAVDGPDHVPAVGAEARGRVVDEPALHRAVDRDAVVVVQRDQLVQLPRAGQRAGLVADAFHQATVAEEHIGVVVDDACGPAG